MKISDLKEGMSNVSIEGKIIEMSEPRSVTTRYGKRNVADALIEDESGEVALSLWEGQIKEVRVGDRVSIKGAFVTRFREKLQVNIPKSGKIEVISP